MSTIDTAACLDYVRNHNLIGIKAGAERDRFLDIWMVVVDSRIFARSWAMAEKSWYSTFLRNKQGFIKCGTTVYEINAVPVIETNAVLMEKINQAYLDKYDSGDNSFYAQGIVKEAHVARTMEFVPVGVHVQ